MSSDGGKGSKPRPYSVTNEEYSKRWDAIFARDLPETEKLSMISDDKNQIYFWVNDQGVTKSPHFDYPEDAEQWKKNN